MEQQIYLSPELAHRLAALDIGTNSIRLVVAEALRDGNYRVLDEEKETTRLGKGLASTGHLDPDAVEHSLAVLRHMQQIAAGFQVREMKTIATCAVREAADGPEFVERVKAETGLDVEIISPEQEAQLAFFSVVRNFSLEGKNVAVADIGGGSTEIILASGHAIEQVFSTPLGAVRMADLAPDDLAGEGFPDLMRLVDKTLRKHTRKPVFAPHLLIGSGGTFTSLGEMIRASRGKTDLPLRGYEITHAEVRHLLDRLRKLSPKARRAVPGLSPDRADIIVPGLAIIDALMRRFRVNVLQVHDRGVRDGLLLTMIDSSLGTTSDDPHDREAAVERFAANCGVDLPHGRQVARLAGLIFAQLIDEFNLDPAAQPLLEAAARLQDVGYLINYERHHKHSYHLILSSRLPGFRPRELELIANIARYHRGSPPKRKHANFVQLTPANQLLVRQMAAILRLAGGFDRSHTQQVQAVIVCRDSDGLEMRAVAPELPEVDIWGARRRAEFFEKVFKRQLTITWQPSTRPRLSPRSVEEEPQPVVEEPTAHELPLDGEPAVPPSNGSTNGHSSHDKKHRKRPKGDRTAG
jgi:exopolyphosphatase/guanosine-5'-triphosphate,3'-diphosphate pyrophosphatase